MWAKSAALSTSTLTSCARATLEAPTTSAPATTIFFNMRVSLLAHERNLGGQLEVDEHVHPAVDLEEAAHRLGGQHLHELVHVLLLEGQVLLLHRLEARDEPLRL